MKFTQKQVLQIIKEEIDAVINEADNQTPQDVADRIKYTPGTRRAGVLNDFENMAAGDTSLQQYYPHVTDLAAFAREVLYLVQFDGIKSQIYDAGYSAGMSGEFNLDIEINLMDGSETTLGEFGIEKGTPAYNKLESEYEDGQQDGYYESSGPDKPEGFV